MASATETALQALHQVLAGAAATASPPLPVPLRNVATAELLEQILSADTTEARIVIRDGAQFDRVEFFGGPYGYELHHRPLVEIIVSGPDDEEREAVFDGLLEWMWDTLAVDPTLNGVVEWAEIDEIGSPDETALEGIPQVKSSIVGIHLAFLSTRAF